MTFTLGRFTTANGVKFAEAGDSLSVSGWFIPAADVVNTMKASRIQLLGLESGDVVPLTSSDHAELDGFYRVSGAVQVAPFDTMLTSGVFSFQLSLERVANGFAAPALEVVTIDGYRSTVNKNPGTSTLYAWIPGSYTWTSGLLYLPRTAADTGAVYGYLATSTALTFGLAASDFYDAAATIEFLLGSTWWPLQGRQLPAGLAIDAVRINNGTLRMIWRTDGDMELEAYSGSAWGSVGDFTFTGTAASVLSTRRFRPYAAPVVSRNDAEMCSLRFASAPVGAPFDFTFFDVSIRRGDHFFMMSTTPFADNGWTLGATSNTASTASATGASLRQTANGAGGHRFVLSSPDAWTADTVAGYISSGASTTMVHTLILGVEVKGSAAVSPDTAAEIEDQMWHATGVHQRVISP